MIVTLLLLLTLPQVTSSFATPAGPTLFSSTVPSRRSLKLFFSTTEEDANVDDAENELQVKPYRNRSMAWTMRYRQLNPYEQARARVISFGHRSKEDWDEAVSSGQLGQYVPNYPNEMYAPEW